MFRQFPRKRSAPAVRARADMALASTIVFFGVLPGALAAGLIVIQAASALGR